MRRAWRAAWRLVALLTVSALALQAYFFAHVALLAWVDPASTSFQRSELWRLLQAPQRLNWQQGWRPYAQIAQPLKRAVIASEDANFVDHRGVEWDAIEKAWDRNQRAQALAARLNDQLAQRQARHSRPGTLRLREAPLRGGSTITQQLAKNLFLSGERTLGRKAQEFVITVMLEALLDKQRILEIYLNHVEWGEGVFGAPAAARYYFGTDVAQLSAFQAARLAVMLPAPKRFEKRPNSPYVLGRASTVAARMGAVELP